MQGRADPPVPPPRDTAGCTPRSPVATDRVLVQGVTILRALITGVRGFAGPHLVQTLARLTDWTIFGVTRHADDTARGYTPIVADLLDREAVQRAIAEVAPTHVFHLAAQSHVPTSLQDPAGTLVNNIVGQVHLLEACRALPAAPRILVVASAEEYGLALPEEMPLDEQQPFRPMSPYAVSKVTQDLLGWQYCRTYGLPIVRVRPFSHTGPGQSDRFAVSAFARQIAEIEAGLHPPVVRVGNLDAERDFLDVRDVVHAYYLALTRGTPGEVYNVGGGTTLRIGAVLEALLALSAVPMTVEKDLARLRPSDVPCFIGDSRRLREETGWHPTIPFEQTVRDTLDWWRARTQASPAPRDQP